ncbi:MAG: vWA domain-containing protein, partial [Halobacteriota archaeon]
LSQEDNGDVFVSTSWFGDRDLDVNLSLVSGTSAGPVERLAVPKNATKTELLAPHASGSSQVWKLTVTERHQSPSIGDVDVYSNYVESGSLDNQFHPMPTEMVLHPADMDAGDRTNPNQVSFIAEVNNGDNAYDPDPFPTPGADHFRMTIGGKYVPSGDVAVNPLGDGKYHVTVTPPPADNAGSQQLCLSFVEKKFGVTESTPTNCGQSVTYRPGGGDGTSIIIDFSIIDLIKPTPVTHVFIDSSADNDTLNVVGAGAETTSTVVPMSHTGDSRGEMKSAVTSAFSETRDVSETDLHGALETGMLSLSESTETGNAVILLSDGKVSREPSEDLLNRYTEMGVPVHVVAVGESANTELLRSIATQTGGEFRTATDSGSLRTAVTDIDRMHGQESTTVSDGLTAEPGAVTTRQFRVDRTIGTLVVRTTLQAGETAIKTGDPTSTTAVGEMASVRLVGPSGETVELDPDSKSGTVRSNVHYSRIGDTVVYRLTDPEAGEWATRLRNSGDGVISAELQTVAETTTTLTTAPDQTQYETGEKVSLAGSLVGGDGPIEGAEVTGTVTGPTGERDEVTFEERTPGSYGAAVEAGEPGTYAATVTAAGEGVERTTATEWTVEPRNQTPVVSVESVTTTPGQETSLDVSLDSIPNGMQRFNVTVCLSDPVATVSGVEAGVTGMVETTAVGDRCVTFRGADLAEGAQANGGPVVLGTVTLGRPKPGQTAVTATVNELLDDRTQTVAARTEAGSLTVEKGETTTIEVVLDGAPHGLSQFNLSVTGETFVTAVDDGDLGDGSVQAVAGGVGTSRVTLDGVDFGDAVDVTDETVVLARLEYAGEVEPDALSLSVSDLRDDRTTTTGTQGGDGQPIDADRVRLRTPSTALYEKPLPGAGGVAPPRDHDGDGRYEDIDGDGDVDFSDAIALAFADTSGLSDAQLAGMDFDGDGDVDFSDAIELAFSV